MASKTNTVDISTASWTAISSGQATVLVSMRSGYAVELAVADAGGDLASLAAGHSLNHRSPAMPFYGAEGNVYARLVAGQLSPVVLVVTAY